MNRRDAMAAIAEFVTFVPLAQQIDPTHPPVNFDQHGDLMPSGMDMASDAVLRARGLANSAATPVLTRSGGNLRHGVYQDAVLTPDLLVKQPPRKLFSVALPGDARGLEGQPLIVPNITRPWALSGARDLLICATMSNHVYAFDANEPGANKDGWPLWSIWLGPPIIGTRNIDGWRINDNWGILSTGVIDGTVLYVVAWTSPDGTPQRGAHNLFAIDLRTGQLAKMALPLAQEGASMQRKQRASLTLLGRTLYIPWGTIQETAAGAHGFVTAVDIDAWKITNELNLSATGSGAGIWMAGQGLSTDGQFLYATTGNGDYDGQANFGESFIKLDAKTLRVVDHWAPFRDRDRANTPGAKDMDLGSGGCIALPDLGLVLGAGKDGILYVLNIENLKAGPVVPPIFFTFNGLGLNASPANVADLDTIMARSGNKTHHMHSTPIYWDSKLYCWGENGNGRMWSIDKTGAVKFVARTAEVASPYAPAVPGGMPGGMMCLSANGTQNGILWACVEDGDANRTVTTGRVFAYDAQKLGGTLPDGDPQLVRLWMSDPHHVYNKFLPPVVSGGKLYVATYDAHVDVYG